MFRGRSVALSMYSHGPPSQVIQYFFVFKVLRLDAEYLFTKQIKNSDQVMVEFDNV